MTAKPPLDWFAMASVLVERAADPTLITDRDGRVRLANAAVASALGYRSCDLVDVPMDRLVSPGDFSLDLATRGAAERLVCSVQTADARTVRAELSFTVVGRGPSLGLIVTLSVTEAQASTAIPVIEFTIASDWNDFGIIREARSSTTGPAPELVGRRCFDVFQCSDVACDRCPALRTRPGVEPEPMVMPSASKGSLLIITAHAVDAHRVLVRQRHIGEAVLGELQRARIAKIAGDAHLSERERAVFEHLLLGRSLEEMAEALGIAVRTVKYHQANVLRKLGAESRVDLLRILV